MTIDWTKPLELMDGTPVRLDPDCSSPDLDGDYWILREDGEKIVSLDNPRFKWSPMCVHPNGAEEATEIICVRNRAEVRTPIDWTKPVETVDGVKVIVVRPGTIKGLPKDESIGRHCGENEEWDYYDDGTVDNDFLPDLRNCDPECDGHDFDRMIGELDKIDVVDGVSPTITLRDRFAMAALTGFMASDGCFGVKNDPKIVWAIADAMLAARGDK